MRSAQLIDLWEEGVGRPSAERGLMLASQSAETAPGAPLGERNERILALRSRVFGPLVEALASCPACGAWVEISFDEAALGARTSVRISEAGFSPLIVDDYHIEYRLPNSFDLAYLLRFASEADAAWMLVQRCVIQAFQDNEAIDTADLPAHVIDALGERMDADDPAGVPTMTLRCAECNHEWKALFDVEAFVWRELNVAARRALVEVHELARAYGWTEDEVLRLSPPRRRMYLGMVRG